MCGSGEETRGESEEGNNDKGGPDSDKDQEVDAIWGGVGGESVPP